MLHLLLLTIWGGGMNATMKKTGGRALVLVVLVAAMATAIVLASGPQAKAANSHTFHSREPAQGANALYSTCPFDDGTIPPNTSVCDDYLVWYFRANPVLGGGALGMAQQPFVARFEHFRWDVIEDRLISYAFGETPDVVGSYDKTHLSYAHFDGATVEMNNVDLQTGEATPTGETVTLGPFTWTAATGIYRFGNDGPTFDDEAPDVRDRCHTTVTHAHQRFTIAHVRGTVEGLQLDTLYTQQFLPGQPENTPGAIFNNHFHVIDVAHGGKNCL
jgi:hypothetical protein